MDPAPLGLGLVLVAIILYLFKEVTESRRDLAHAERRIDEFQAMFSRMRPDNEGPRTRVLSDRRQDDRAIEMKPSETAGDTTKAGEMAGSETAEGKKPAEIETAEDLPIIEDHPRSSS
ncbi:MAG: hypothetical protein KDJ37_00730 [Hyphomicrobiaceae bacterium]|nr:hypothetical protein [Hyphomicrobiaceae bacterium]